MRGTLGAKKLVILTNLTAKKPRFAKYAKFFDFLGVS
jgi:hypothetical protein